MSNKGTTRSAKGVRSVKEKFYEGWIQRGGRMKQNNVSKETVTFIESKIS